MQAGFVLHDFILTRLEILHHFSNLCSNFRFNAIWHGWFVATFIFCRRLTEVISLSHSQSHVWIDYVGDVIVWLM